MTTDIQPILSPDYWSNRLEVAFTSHLHHAVFKCPIETWKAIEERHQSILKNLIKPDDSILDVGCGWGRLLNLLPSTWNGRYVGVDLSPDFVRMARRIHPNYIFTISDVRDFLRTLVDKSEVDPMTFDWAILISIRPMVKRNLGNETWEVMEQLLHTTCRKILYLEYDSKDKGCVE